MNMSLVSLKGPFECEGLLAFFTRERSKFFVNRIIVPSKVSLLVTAKRAKLTVKPLWQTLAAVMNVSHVTIQITLHSKSFLTDVTFKTFFFFMNLLCSSFTFTVEIFHLSNEGLWNGFSQFSLIFQCNDDFSLIFCSNSLTFSLIRRFLFPINLYESSNKDIFQHCMHVY